MDGRQGGAEEQPVGKFNDIARFEFGHSADGHVLKAGRRKEDSRLGEPNSLQGFEQVVPREGE